MSISAVAIKWMFTCDRCNNTVEFYNGMTTWKLDYLQPNSEDQRSFCSEICVREIYRLEKEGK